MKTQAWWRRMAVAVLDALDLHSSVLLRRKGPLLEDGWFVSFRAKRPVNADGQPIPWLTYPAIDFLAGRVDARWQVFEYGCGQGTLWWAARVRRVAAVETDPAWAASISERLPSSATLQLVPIEAAARYVETIAASDPPFDVIIIDGAHRPDCLRRAPQVLTSGGVIIVDNSERPEYREAIDALRARGFRRVDFWGLVPAVCWKSCTSIFYRDGNCLGL